MRVVQEAVADRVGQGGLSKVVVPLRRRELAGEDRGAGAVAVLEDLEEVPALLVLDGSQAEIVELCGAPHNSTDVEYLVMWSWTWDPG